MGKGRESVEVNCPKCHGTGFVSRKCPQCNGKMTIGRNRFGEDVPCGLCSAGEVEDACGTCGGAGTVTI